MKTDEISKWDQVLARLRDIVRELPPERYQELVAEILDSTDPHGDAYVGSVYSLDFVLVIAAGYQRIIEIREGL